MTKKIFYIDFTFYIELICFTSLEKSEDELKVLTMKLQKKSSELGKF